MDFEKEIPFGAFDSELMYQEIYIPEGFKATIKGNRIILKKIESEDEKIRKALVRFHKSTIDIDGIKGADILAWLEKQGKPQDKGEISDGYHTFNELYYYRMLYNAAFFNMLPKEWVHKSKRHNDGEECFGGGWFIVMANLPTGQISNHYELKDWDLFQIPEKEVADKWDGHTPQEAADRLHKYLLEKQRESTLKSTLIEEIKRRKELLLSEKEKALSISENLSLGGRIAMLEELLVFVNEKQGEQKQEWSETDENRFQNIIACIEDCYNEKDAQDLIRWFKSLRHQPKQVWSKADIKMLELIIDGYQNTEDFSKVDGVFVDWLKSLKNRMQGKED